MESQTVEVLNTIEIGDHQNEIILTNFEGLATETVTSSQGNEIVGIFEVQPSGETETILTQGFYIAQGEGENELFLVGVSSDQDNPSEQTVAQFVQSSGVNSTIPIHCADAKLVIGESGDIVRSSIVESSIDSGAVTCVAEAPQEYQSVLISEEGLNEVTVKSNSGMWAYAEEGSNEKEDVVFIPNSKLSSDAIFTALDKNNRKLLQIAPVTQKMDEDHESSEPAHEFIVNESVETVTTDQQDQIVSSSCGLNSRKQAVDTFNTNSANEMSVADAHFSNEGLDLSMNKVVQGVSVIHVTSSSDFTVNEEFGDVHHKIVEVETDGYSTENANFENSNIHCSTVLDSEQQITEDIDPNSEMNEGQVLNMNDKYELSEEQDFSNQSVPIDGYICEEDVNHMMVTHNATQVVNEANISNRSSSVLVYSGKEIPEQQDNQSIPQDSSLIADENTTDDSNSMIQFANKNQNYDGAFNNVNNLSADETEVRKSVLACKQLDECSEQAKELSDPCHDLPKEDNSDNMNMVADVNQNINVNSIESEVTRSPLLSKRVSSKRGESLKGNVTVIKSPQKTFSRRSKRQSKSIKASEINTDADIPKQVIDETVQSVHDETLQSVHDETLQSVHDETLQSVHDETLQSVHDETVQSVHDETDNSRTLASMSKEIINQPIANSPDVVSELSSDSKMNPSANESIDQQFKETNEHLETNAEMNESPQVPMAVCTDVLSNSLPNEAILQPPKKTYLRKRKQLLRSEPISIKDNSSSLDGDIELFSCADLDERVSSEDVTPIKLAEDNSNTTSETNNKAFSSDDDSLLFSSDIRNKGSTTYKRRKTTEAHVPDFLESIRKRNVDTEDTLKQNIEDVMVASEAVISTEDIAPLPEPAPSTEVVSNSNALPPKRPKRVITKKKRYGEDDDSPASKRRAQSLPSAAVAKSLDIENDINEMTAPIAKKNKPKPSSPFVASETSFYPSASVSFMEQARNKVSKKKRGGSLGGLGKKSSPKGVILNHSNGSLTRRQLNDRLNEYNFSDSEETPTEDNVDSRGYSSETFNKGKRSKKYTPKNKGGTSSLIWNKFLKSSPVKRKTTKYLTKIKRKVARRFSDSKEKLSPNSDSKKVHFSPQVKEQQLISDNDDDFCQFRIQDSYPINSSVTTYHCINCEYDTKRVNNYILHLKECMKSPRVNEEEISDMDRRQQIRGYDSCSQCFSSFSTTEGMEVNRFYNSAEERNADDMETDDESHQEVAEEDFEFSKYDIVWIEVKRVYWPSLILHVYPQKNKASIYFIDCPLDDGLDKCCTVDIKYLQSFDNVEINKKHLIDGKDQKHSDAFVKALQKAEDFLRKRKCLGINLPVERYFKGLPKLKKQDGEVSNDDEFLDVLNLTADIIDCVKKGQIDDHLNNVFNGKAESYRHKNFFSDDPTSQKEVAVSPWFGPVTHIDDQTTIYDHLCAFFNNYCNSEGDFNVNFYMYHVWCPEGIYASDIREILHANRDCLHGRYQVHEKKQKFHPLLQQLIFQVIIKAISEIKGISIAEAEEMFVDRSTYKLSRISSSSTDVVCI